MAPHPQINQIRRISTGPNSMIRFLKPKKKMKMNSSLISHHLSHHLRKMMNLMKERKSRSTMITLCIQSSLAAINSTIMILQISKRFQWQVELAQKIMKKTGGKQLYKTMILMMMLYLSRYKMIHLMRKKA